MKRSSQAPIDFNPIGKALLLGKVNHSIGAFGRTFTLEFALIPGAQKKREQENKFPAPFYLEI
jgi:hypothetical protein